MMLTVVGVPPDGRLSYFYVVTSGGRASAARRTAGLISVAAQASMSSSQYIALPPTSR